MQGNVNLPGQAIIESLLYFKDEMISLMIS